MGDQPWMHDSMKREAAEDALHALGGEDGMFVVRGHKDLTKKVLSVMFRGKPTHHLVSLADERVTINKKQIKECTTLSETITTLMTEKVSGWPVRLTQYPESPQAPQPDSVQNESGATASSRVLEDGSIVATLVRGDGPIGLAYVGPSADDDPRVGNFVTKIRPDTPAALAEGIELGMRIISVGGFDTRNVPKTTCTDQFKAVPPGGAVEVVLAHDNEALALFKGEASASPQPEEAQNVADIAEANTADTGETALSELPVPGSEPLVGPELQGVTNEPQSLTSGPAEASQVPEQSHLVYDVIAPADYEAAAAAAPAQSSEVNDGMAAETASIHAFSDALGPEGFVLGEPAWLHTGLDRTAAVRLLSQAGLSRTGLFLVRKRSDPSTFAIDLAFMDNTVHHLVRPHPADRSLLGIHGADMLGTFPTINEVICVLALPSNYWPCVLTEYVPTASVDPTGNPVPLTSPGTAQTVVVSHGGGQNGIVTEAESRPADGMVTDITQLPVPTMAVVDGTWKCGECGTMNHSNPRDSRARRCAECGVVRALRRARSDEVAPEDTPQGGAATKPKVSIEAEEDRSALERAVQVLSAVRQDKLYEAVARYVNRKWSITDLVLGLGEILKGIDAQNRRDIEDKLGKLIPVSQRAQFALLCSRAAAEEEIEEGIKTTDLEELATLTRLVANTLARLRGDTRTDVQITSFERRVQLASTQRAWAVTKLQAANDESFTVELVAKAVHVGWARSVVSTWAPEYGIEPLGNLVLNDRGLLDSFNFSVAHGYKIYQQRVVLASQRYALPGDDIAPGVRIVPEASKHFYRVAAEILIHACQRLDSDSAAKQVVREDTFAYVELKQLGLLSSTPMFASRRSSGRSTPRGPMGRRGDSLTGRNNNAGLTTQFAFPEESSNDGSMGVYSPPPYENGEAAPPWFHDVMDKETASSLLALEDDGTFLVRQRPGKADFALGFKFQGMVTHHLITAEQDGILQVNGMIVVREARTLDELIVGLYQRQPEWPSPLQSFIPRAGVSSATVVRVQSDLAGLSAPQPSTALSTAVTDDQGDTASLAGSVDWSRGRSSSITEGDMVVAVSLLKDDGPLGITFAGPRDADDPRVGVFVTQVAEGTPAAKTGKLFPGLRIVSVKAIDTKKMSKGEVAMLFKGEPGDVIDVVLQRDTTAYEKFMLTDPDSERADSQQPDQYGEAMPIGLPKAPTALPEGATQVSLVVPSDGPLGITFVGPKKKKDSRRGIFITDVAEDSPAATTEGVAARMRILSVNGIDTTDAFKKDCSKIFRSLQPGEEVVLVLTADEEGFLQYADVAAAPATPFGRDEGDHGRPDGDTRALDPEHTHALDPEPHIAALPQGNGLEPPIEHENGPASNTTTTPAASGAQGEYEYNVPARLTKATIVKGTSPLGLRIVGPKGPADPREGIFVTAVKEGSPGANAVGGTIEPGMRILSINGVPTLKATKDECKKQFNVEPGDKLEIVLDADDEAYRLFTSAGAKADPDAVAPQAVESPLASSPPAQGSPPSSPMVIGSVSEADIGRRVSVDGYDVPGTLLFVGPHHISGSNRCGIALDEPIGKNDGIVKGHRYFECRPKCGVLCGPKKVTLLQDDAGTASPPPLKEAPTFSVTIVKSASLGMSVAHRNGLGNFITVLKPGGAAEAAFANSAHKHSAADGIRIVRLNGINLANEPKAEVTKVLKATAEGEGITIEYELNKAGVKDSPPASKKTGADSTAAVPKPLSEPDMYDGMKRMEIIKLLRSRNVDYHDAKNIEELKALARQGNANTDTPPTVAAQPASVDASPAAPTTPVNGADDYDGMKRLQLIKLLRKRGVDYSGAKNADELKQLARQSDSSGAPKWITQMGRDEATRAIVSAGVPGGFLVRPSDRSSSGYTLTTFQNGKPLNFGIELGGDKKYGLSKSPLKFDSIEAVVRAHMQQTHGYFREVLVALPQFE